MRVGLPGRKAIAVESGRFLTVYGLASADRFVVTPSATVEIFIDGGDPARTTPGDVLSLSAGGATFTLEPGLEADEGVFRVEGRQPVRFDHIESLNVSEPGSVLVVGTCGDDEITIIARDESTHAGADGVRDFTFSVNGGAEILLINTASLSIDTLGGDDTIIIRTSAPNQANWDVTTHVVGGTGSDTLVYVGTSVDDTISVSGSAIINNRSGAVLLLNVDGVETLYLEGLEGTISLRSMRLIRSWQSRLPGRFE